MTSDPREVDEMARLMAIMSGKAAPARKTTQGAAKASDNGVDMMKSILSKFYNAGSNAAARLDEESTIDREVREAMITERTAGGARIGNWEIRVKLHSTRKVYDVYNVHSNDNIANDLQLYEAAHALVKLLNKGVAINTEQVREVLTLEEQYCKNRLDAVMFRNKTTRLNEAGESQKAAIAEDRYLDAKTRAVHAREKLRNLSERL